MVITAVDCMTGVGLGAASTAASVRAGISSLRLSDQFEDSYGSPIIESCIPWLRPEEESPEPEEERSPEDEPTPEPGAEEEEAEVGEREGEGDREPEEADAGELARQADDIERVVDAARECLASLLEIYLGQAPWCGGAASLLLGVSRNLRPGPRFEGAGQEHADELLESLRGHVPQADLKVLALGNPSALHGLKLAADRLADEPASICVVGAIDSLLPLETLNWYEAAERLKSGSVGRNHGLSPAEAVGFIIVETAETARRGGRRILAEVKGLGLATEPNPFLSDRPSMGQGLTDACRAALEAGGVPPGEIGTVLGDPDGEFHRAKEWALAEIRCFGSAGKRDLLHPADCMGSVGAASGAVLISIAAVGFSRGWFTKPALVFCSDDGGECGAVVLTPPDGPARR